MERLDATQLRKKLFKILDRLPQGETFLITRRGKPVAQITMAPAEVRGSKPKIDPRRVANLCKKHGVRRLALFGSILRDDFGPDSDVDVLYDAERPLDEDFYSMIDLRDALSKLFGRPIDLVNRRTLLKSTNLGRQREILNTAKAIYEG